jgi:8-oxo-dGTP diphosphatase
VEFTDYDTRLAVYAVITDPHGKILLTWYNGRRRGRAGWTLPGGGVEYAETIEEALVREVREETGYEAELGPVMFVHSFTSPEGPCPPRPYKSVQIVYAATVRGGTLGTLEVDGTTDRAVWMPLDEVLSTESRSGIVDAAVAALRDPSGG